MIKRKGFNLQLFAEDNITKTTDLEPAISVDLTTRFTKNINELRELMGIAQMEPIAAGSNVKIYKMTQANTPAQVAEGEVIPLTKFDRKKVREIEVVLKKYRKLTTAEAIQRSGQNVAVNMTDSEMEASIRKEIKTGIFSVLATGTGTASGTTLQKALAAAWGELQKYYNDMDATPIYFISSEDVAEYLGDTVVTTQTAFGMSYIENFLGLGRTIISPNVAKGKVIATAQQNLRGVYVPASGGDVATTLGLIGDETGLIGMRHDVDKDTAGLATLMLSGVVFFPEFLDGVIVSTIGSGTTNTSGGTGGSGDTNPEGA